MDFRHATDVLFDRVTHEQLADLLHASVPAIRQSRLQNKALAYRLPPAGWHEAVRKLAEARVRHFQYLVDELSKASQ